VIALVLAAAEAEELGVAHLRALARLLHRAREERAVEDLVARGDGGVDREHRAGGDAIARVLEGRARLTLVAETLEQHEGRVPLVEVEDLGLDAEGLEGAGAADAEDELLTEARLASGDVEVVGQAAEGGGVVVAVGVEEEQRHASDAGEPHADVDDAVADLDGDGELLVAARRADGADGDLAEIEAVAVVLLPTFRIEGLAEVAAPVEEADGDEGELGVRGGLEVVAGEDAEAAGEDGEARVHAELGAEVGDPRLVVGALFGADLLGRVVKALLGLVVEGAARDLGEGVGVGIELVDAEAVREGGAPRRRPGPGEVVGEGLKVGIARERGDRRRQRFNLHHGGDKPDSASGSMGSLTGDEIRRARPVTFGYFAGHAAAPAPVRDALCGDRPRPGPAPASAASGGSPLGRRGRAGAPAVGLAHGSPR
jgi:hypothetical protein